MLYLAAFLCSFKLQILCDTPYELCDKKINTKGTKLTRRPQSSMLSFVPFCVEKTFSRKFSYGEANPPEGGAKIFSMSYVSIVVRYLVCCPFVQKEKQNTAAPTAL